MLTADDGIPRTLDAPPARQAPSRFAELDTLRGLAALWVVLHHVCLTCWSFPEVPIAASFAPWISWLKYGHSAVTLFITLSGFVIVLPLTAAGATPNWRRFFSRRCKRILPPYYAALLFSVAVVVWYHGWKAVRAADLVGHLLLLHDWGVGIRGAFNGPMWSIPVEWHIYFSVPILYFFWRKFGVLRTTVAWVAVSLTIFCLMPRGDLRDGMSIHYYGIFAIGAATAFLSRSGALKRRHAGLVLAAGFVLAAATWCVLTFAFGWDWSIDHYAWCDLAFAVAVAIGIAAISQYPHRFGLLRQPWLLLLGSFSYSLYLTHGPILANCNERLSRIRGISPESKFLLLTALAVPLCLVLAWLFHRVFERPFMSSAKPGAKAVRVS